MPRRVSTVTFTAVEQLDTPPVVTLAGQAMARDGSAPDYRYALVIPEHGMPAGWADLELALVDRAGNRGQVSAPEMFFLDYDPPEVLGAAVEPPLARGDSVIQVRVIV